MIHAHLQANRARREEMRGYPKRTGGVAAFRLADSRLDLAIRYRCEGTDGIARPVIPVVLDV